MKPQTCTRRLEWDAAHRVMRHESKCANLHGHRYAAEITCTAAKLDRCDRVIDFGLVKDLLGLWIDEHLDHGTLVNRNDHALADFVRLEALQIGRKPPFLFDGEPTAENIAAMLLKQARALLTSHGVEVIRVRVYETPNCWADAEVEP